MHPLATTAVAALDSEVGERALLSASTNVNPCTSHQCVQLQQAHPQLTSKPAAVLHVAPNRRTCAHAGCHANTHGIDEHLLCKLAL
jgi:hypothetical protein